MSRQIIACCKNGYVTKTNGSYWRVNFDGQGQYLSTSLVTHNSNGNQSRLTYAIGLLGGLDSPNHTNGFTVLRGIGLCGDHPNEMIVQVRNGNNIYRAYEDSQIPGYWHFIEITTDYAEYCGAEVEYTPVDEMPEPEPWKLPFSASKDYTAATLWAVVIGIGVIMFFTWKK